MANTHRNRELETRWRSALARQRQSGLTISEFCRRERLGEASFHAWPRTLAERDAALPSRCDTCRDAREDKASSRACPITPIPAFVPVAPRAVETQAFVIEPRGGRALRLPEAIPDSRLVALVHALEADYDREGPALFYKKLESQCPHSFRFTGFGRARDNRARRPVAIGGMDSVSTRNGPRRRTVHNQIAVPAPPRARFAANTEIPAYCGVG